MKGIKIEIIAGLGLIASNVAWNHLGRSRRGEPKKLTTRHAKPGIYYLEGQLESTDPSEYNNQMYAKLICTTNQAVKLPDNKTEFSQVSGTTITQINSEQKLTIDDFDVTLLLDRFPMSTIQESQNTLIRGVPVRFGSYRLIGHWDGEKMTPVSQTQVVSELSMPQNSSTTDWAASIIGSTLVLSGILMTCREARFF